MKRIELTTSNHQTIIKETLTVLKTGGLVVFPTDTVYGLLADSTNPEAVTKLLQFKERRPGQAISVFVADKKMAKEYIILNQNAENIINNLLPGPFTVIAESRCHCEESQTTKQSLNFQEIATPFGLAMTIDPRLLAENGTLGIRIPDYPLINQLLTAYGRPLTATSANMSGKPPHYLISSFLKSLSDNKKSALNLIVDGGILPKNKPSTVIDTTTGQLKTLRVGDLLPKAGNCLISKSEDDTKELARFLASKFIKKNVSTPLVFLLEGNLGAGKTIFAKGLGKALGVIQEIVSPTYSICYEYPINLPGKSSTALLGNDIKNSCQKTTKYISKNQLKLKTFVHYDLFRIDSLNDLKEIGFLNSFHSGNIYVIEWAERLPAEIISALKNLAEIIYIRINYLKENEREINWS